MIIINKISSAFLRDCVETLCRGQDAAASDFILAANEWGLNLKTISAHVHISNGQEDLNVPPDMARYLAETLPHNTLHLLPDEGHPCLFTYWEEILTNISEKAYQSIIRIKSDA